MSHQRTVKNTIISRNDTISTEECSLILLQPTGRKLFFFVKSCAWVFGRPLNWSQDAADLFGCNAWKHIVHDVKKRKRRRKKCSVAFLHPRAVELEKLKDERKRDVRTRRRHTGNRQCVLWLDDGDDVNGDTMSANDPSDAFNGWNRNRNKHCLKEISCICMCCVI